MLKSLYAKIIMNELERLNSIKRWLKGKKLPEAEKDIMRGLINLRKIELEKEAEERIKSKVRKFVDSNSPKRI